jgi:DNA repair exonuclease SbcCD nuclease subunit
VRIAHLADLHLGFRQHHRQTPAGINQREADVANAFRAVVDDVLAAEPDAVLIAGDLFHAVRPTNHSIVFAFRQLQRLIEGLPGVPVVIIAGNHDTPRSTETGSILRLFEELGVALATDEPRRIEFPDRDLSVLAVPHGALFAAERPVLRPAGAAKYQVLMLHGEVEGVFPSDRSSVEYGGALLDPAELTREAWSYVALGHYHVSHQVGPRIWYAGAPEYVSPNPWGELADEARHGTRGKAWLLVDLDSGAVERRPVPAARGVHDLRRLDAAGQAAEAIDRSIAERLASVPGGLDGAVVRLVVENIPRHVVRELDHAAIRAAKARALHLHLDFRRPRSEGGVGNAAPGQRQTLPELVESYLARRPLPERLSRERFVALGLEVMAEAEAGDDGA